MQRCDREIVDGSAALGRREAGRQQGCCRGSQQHQEEQEQEEQEQ